jgi:predicted nuclease of restriction endonuclease-like RecB superfamily
VARQENLVRRLRRRGYDTAQAENLLDTFRKSLALMRRDLEEALAKESYRSS